MMYRALAFWIALVAVLAPDPAWSQSLALSSAVVALPNAGVAQLNAGYVDHGGMSIAIDPGSETSTWDLYLTADQGSLGASKSLSDLQWRLEGTSTWTSVTPTSQKLASGIGTGTVTVYFRIRLRWSGDPPGDYGSGLTLSLG